MTLSIDHSDLDEALRGCGSHWAGAQAHGLLCGRLAVHGADGAGAWRDLVLESAAADAARQDHCAALLEELFHDTWRGLAERQSEFELLLPDDAADTAERTRALAEWCEGFLHGLVSDTHTEAVRRRLAAEPLADMIRDMLEITRATVGDDDPETAENAYAELVEFVRVAAQLAYEELAELRAAPISAIRAAGSSDSLH